MKRREAEHLLAALSGYESAMAALAAMVSLTDSAKHLGYPSIRDALDGLKRHKARTPGSIAPPEHAAAANGEWRPLTHAAPTVAARPQAGLK